MSASFEWVLQTKPLSADADMIVARQARPNPRVGLMFCESSAWSMGRSTLWPRFDGADRFSILNSYRSVTKQPGYIVLLP